ncbi:GTPase domain-containing protein [Deltaproteobacteria bacterium PRO3]|nr:GTPase domain-containing protein [Deltaproteobacteria bacterium PRO3]
MSFINYQQKEINFKIVYYGPAQSGKTTCLEYLFEKTKGSSKSKLIQQESNERTLFFDFMPLFLSEVDGYKTRFHLYTVPGQVLYEDSRKLILKGVDGIVFVADSSVDQMEANLRSMESLQTNLTEQALSLDKVPLLVQYNKRDLPNVANLEAMRKLLNPFKKPDFETVAKQGEGVFEAFSRIAKDVIRDYAESA